MLSRCLKCHSWVHIVCVWVGIYSYVTLFIFVLQRNSIPWHWKVSQFLDYTIGQQHIGLSLLLMYAPIVLNCFGLSKYYITKSWTSYTRLDLRKLSFSYLVILMSQIKYVCHLQPALSVYCQTWSFLQHSNLEKLIIVSCGKDEKLGKKKRKKGPIAIKNCKSLESQVEQHILF